MPEANVRPLRTVLFAPGDDEAEVAAAIGSGADSVVIDLEEPSTPCTEQVREQARRVARAALDRVEPGAGVPLVFARVQPPSTGQTLKDLRAVIGPSLAGVLLPKVESPGRCARPRRAAHLHGGRPRIAPSRAGDLSDS